MVHSKEKYKFCLEVKGIIINNNNDNNNSNRNNDNDDDVK